MVRRRRFSLEDTMLDKDEKKESGGYGGDRHRTADAERQKGKFCGHPCRINDPPPDRESRVFSTSSTFFIFVFRAKKLMDGKAIPQE